MKKTGIDSRPSLPSPITWGRPRKAILLALGAAALLVLPAASLAKPAPAGGGASAVGSPEGTPGWGRGDRGRGGPGGRFGKAGRHERMAKALNLTQAQAKQIQALREKHQAGMAKVRLQKMRIKAELRVEWLKDAPSEAKIRGLADQLTKVHASQAKARLDMRLKVNSMLTPEQRAKAKSMGMGMGMGPPRGRFGGGGGMGKGRAGGHGKGMGRGRGGGHGFRGEP